MNLAQMGRWPVVADWLDISTSILYDAKMLDRRGIRPYLIPRTFGASLGRTSGALVLLLCIACAEGVGVGEAPETDGPTVGGDGTFWCATISGAFGWDGEVHEEILGPEETPPEGCECADANLTTAIQTLLNLAPNARDLDMDMDDDIIVSGDSIQIGDEADELIVNFRDQVILNAEAECLALRTLLSLGPSQNPGTFPDCSDIADLTDEPDNIEPGPDVLAIFESSPCTVMDELMPDTSGYDDFHDLESAVSYNTMSQVYEIDGNFLDDMFVHPDWWLQDSARIHPMMGGGYEIKSVAMTDVAYALGLRTNDKFISINSSSLNDIADAAAAIEEFRTDSSHTLVVQRGVNQITLDYEVY